jgi:hypothetical protein
VSAPKQYRKKPVVIEAMQLTDDIRQHIAVRQWAADATPEGEPIPVSITAFDSTMIIRTLEGEMRADLGDFIIKGVNGEFYPCKPDIFAKTYEAVE